MALALEPDLDGPFGSTEVMEPIYFDETGLRVMSTGSKYAQGQVMDPSTGLDRYYNPIKHQAPCKFLFYLKIIALFTNDRRLRRYK
jgi:hypothetical protein